MLAVSEPGALNFYTFFRLIPLTLFVIQNRTLTHLPLFESLNSLHCELIAPTPGLAFSLVMPRTPATVSSFSSGRAYFFLNFLLPLSSLDPCSNYVEVNIPLTTPSRSHFLMCTLLLSALLRRIAKPTPFLPPFFPPQEISSF